MDITLIAITFFLLVAILFLLSLLLNNFNKKLFIAADGSVFETQIDLELYQKLYERTKPIFLYDEQQSSSQSILGFEKSFLAKLTTEGFTDLRALLKYRKQFKSLSDLINN